MTATTLKPEQYAGLLESEIANELLYELTSGDKTYWVGNRKFRMAYLEEISDELADEDTPVMIDPESGDLFEIEVQVYARKLVPPKPEPVVDPNQLVLDTGPAPS